MIATQKRLVDEFDEPNTPLDWHKDVKAWDELYLKGEIPVSTYLGGLIKYLEIFREKGWIMGLMLGVAITWFVLSGDINLLGVASEKLANSNQIIGTGNTLFETFSLSM